MKIDEVSWHLSELSRLLDKSMANGESPVLVLYSAVRDMIECLECITYEIDTINNRLSWLEEKSNG